MLLLAVLAIQITPAFATEPVANDSDDPAVWVHPTQPERSVILGTNKHAKPTGGIAVFDLRGRTVQTVPVDKPNNVDVEYGFNLNGKRVDLAVATERGTSSLRIFAIENGRLRDVTGDTRVFRNETGVRAEPMGVGLYANHQLGRIEAVVSRKSGPIDGYLGLFKLVANRRGKVDVTQIGQFGQFSGTGEIESVLVDDATKTVFFSDEAAGIRSFNMETREERIYGIDGFLGDREGLAMLAGRLMATDQIKGGSRLHAFDPNGNGWPLQTFLTGADDTDGIDICDRPLGSRFPRGILVAMNSRGRNFLVYDLRQLLERL